MGLSGVMEVGGITGETMTATQREYNYVRMWIKHFWCFNPDKKKSVGRIQGALMSILHLRIVRILDLAFRKSEKPDIG